MIEVLRQRNFTLVWVSGLISMTGDWVLIVALPIYVYSLTRSPMATSLAFVAELLPSLLLGSVAGVYVDRWPRKEVMLVSNILLVFILLPLLLVRSADLVWIVYAVGFLQSTVAQFINPAEAALLPTLVSQDQLVTANSLSSLNQNIARLGGPALGGLIAVSTGLAGVTLIDAGSFVVAALLVALLRVPRQPEHTASETSDAGLSAVWHQWLDGLRLVRGSRGLSILIAIFTLTSLGEGVFGTMFVIWVKQVLHGTALQLGWFMSAQAIGGILGGAVIGAVGSRVAPHRLAWIGAMIFALLDITLFSYPLVSPQVWIGLTLIVLVGIPAAAGGSSMRSLLQLATPDRYRGRVFGALGTTSALSGMIGTLIAGAFGGIFGPIALMNVFQGGSYLVAGAMLFLTSAHLIQQAAARRSEAIAKEA